MKFLVGRRSNVAAAVLVLLVVRVFSGGATRFLAQVSATPPSAKSLLEAYRKRDAEGERLTAKGWYAASGFFLKPLRRPENRVVGVMRRETVEDPDPWFKGGENRLRITVERDELGQIDSLGRFTTVLDPLVSDA